MRAHAAHPAYAGSRPWSAASAREGAAASFGESSGSMPSGRPSAHLGVERVDAVLADGL